MTQNNLVAMVLLAGVGVLLIFVLGVRGGNSREDAVKAAIDCMNSSQFKAFSDVDPARLNSCLTGEFLSKNKLAVAQLAARGAHLTDHGIKEEYVSITFPTDTQAVVEAFESELETIVDSRGTVISKTDHGPIRVRYYLVRLDGRWKVERGAH